MTTRVGVVLFPGSNCELDALEAVRGLGGDAELLWHGDASVRAYLDVPSATNPTGATPAQIAVTVVPGSAGLLNSSGPFQVDEPGAHYTLEKIDGNRCAVAWNDPVDPATVAVPATPVRTHPCFRSNAVGGDCIK